MTLNPEICSDELLRLARIDISLEDQVTRDEALVRRFCERFGTGRVVIDITHENGNPEPLYVFADNLGGYTSEGIRKSLDS